jgi:hypothetical protein
MSDLFDFFKQNESKLHEKPPERVWQKLEQQLKEKRPRPKRRGIPFLQLGTVALVITILIFIGLMVWYFVKKT